MSRGSSHPAVGTSSQRFKGGRGVSEGGGRRGERCDDGVVTRRTHDERCTGGDATPSRRWETQIGGKRGFSGERDQCKGAGTRAGTTGEQLARCSPSSLRWGAGGHWAQRTQRGDRQDTKRWARQDSRALFSLSIGKMHRRLLWKSFSFFSSLAGDRRAPSGSRRRRLGLGTSGDLFEADVLADDGLRRRGSR